MQPVHLVKPASGIRIVHQGPWHFALLPAIISAPFLSSQRMREIDPRLSGFKLLALKIHLGTYQHAFVLRQPCSVQQGALCLGDDDINLSNRGVDVDLNLNLSLCNLCRCQIWAGLWASRPGQTSPPAELQAGTESAMAFCASPALCTRRMSTSCTAATARDWQHRKQGAWLEQGAQ